MHIFIFRIYDFTFQTNMSITDNIKQIGSVVAEQIFHNAKKKEKKRNITNLSKNSLIYSKDIIHKRKKS